MPAQKDTCQPSLHPIREPGQVLPEPVVQTEHYENRGNMITYLVNSLLKRIQRFVQMGKFSEKGKVII